MKKLLLFIILLIITGLGFYFYKESPVAVIEKDSRLEMDNDFKTFWEELKFSVKNNKKESIINLVQVPFLDGYGDVYNPIESLTSNSRKKIIENYEAIFNEEVKKAIIEDRYRTHNPQMFIDGDDFYDVIEKNEFLLQPNTNIQNRDLIFKKVNDKYKITGIQYYQ